MMSLFRKVVAVQNVAVSPVQKRSENNLFMLTRPVGYELQMLRVYTKVRIYTWLGGI